MREGLTSVVIVAADSGPLLGEAVARVLAEPGPLEVVVSDNASRDGSIERLVRDLGHDARLRVLHNGTNLGFGAGVNRGAAQAAGDVLLILNPDCLIEPGTLERLRVLLAAEPQAGLVGVRVVDAEGRTEPAARRRDPTLRRSAMTLSGLSRWERCWPALAGVNVPIPDAVAESDETPVAQPVEAVSGASMCLPRSVFDRLGGFDEGYFLHCEDLDLCRRVRDAGLYVLYAGGIRVRHVKGTSSRHRPVFVAWHKHRGMWRWFVKFDPAARSRFLRGLVAVLLWVHFAVAASVTIAGRASRRQTPADTATGHSRSQ